MANGDKSKKQEERTKRIGIRQGERTRRKEAKLKAKTERIKARHPQNERMEEHVGQALNFNTLMENKDLKKLRQRPEGAIDIPDGGWETRTETGFGTQVVGYNSDGSIRYQSK